MTEPVATGRERIVLVVEDNPADANLIEESLVDARVGASLRVVTDGERAIAFFDRVDADDEHPRPDLVLLDLNLPRVSGEQVLKRIRQSSRCADTKVLIVSSSNAPSDRELVMRLGATDYFRKPSNLAQFMDLGRVVRDML